jgi:hypothetical protein
MSITLENLRSLGQSNAGQELETLVPAPTGIGAIHVLLANADQCRRLTLCQSGYDDTPLVLDIGCASKLLTTMTFFHVFGDRGSILSQSVAELLDINVPTWFSKIQVSHLLDHTHGIDEPKSQLSMIHRDGMMDASTILRGIGADPLAAPGTKYSYSAVGFRLLAAIVECTLRKRFEDVVRELFPTLFSAIKAGYFLCPAYGGVQINAEEFLQQCVRATSRSDHEGKLMRLGLGLITPYSGWHPFETGVCKGWKTYKHGWYGHQSLFTSTRISLRVSPDEGVGFLVSSDNIPPWKLINTIFSEDVIGAPIPQRRTYASSNVYMFNRDFVGVYDRVDIRIEVKDIGKSLELEIFTLVRDGATSRAQSIHQARLIAVSPSLFSVTPPMPSEGLGFVEFIRDREDRVCHLWNGGRLWRRILA